MSNINIEFPFRISEKGDFVRLTQTDKQAIKSNIFHLLTTQKGSRYMKPEFGTNLLKYIFEQNDGITQEDVQEAVSEVLKKYFPNLRIKSLTVEDSDQSEYLAVVRLDYVVSEGVFEFQDFIIINV